MLDCHTHYNKTTKNEKWIATSNSILWKDNIKEFYGLGHLPFTLFDSYQKLESLLDKNPNYYLGEWGLDKKSNLDIFSQLKILDSVISIAKNFNRIVVLHSNGFNDKIVNIIQSNKDVKFLYHGFRFDKSIAKAMTKYNNCVLGIGRHYFKSKYSLDALENFPVLFETDWDENLNISYEKAFNDLIKTVKDFKGSTDYARQILEIRKINR